MKFFKRSVKRSIKQSIMALSGFILSTSANAYGLVFQPEAQVTSIPEPSVLSLVVVGVIAVGLSRRNSRRKSRR